MSDLQQPSLPEVPVSPKLRAVDPKWVQYRGESYLLVRDPLDLTDQSVLVPQHLAPLLALCDGTRDILALRAALALRTGVQLTESQARDFLAQLDGALLLENVAYQRAVDKALSDYRETKHRRPSHAGSVYPADADDLSATLRQYCCESPATRETQPAQGTLVGIVCPHIDYARGHQTYAQLWQRAAPALDEVELVIVFGTDHSGAPGMLTPTRQNYATPLGVLPTEQDIVDGLARVLGPDIAFAQEIHHIKEHSIELALVWLQHFRRAGPCPVVPILCGSFEHFIAGKADPSKDGAIEEAMGYLKSATAGRRTLVIASGDLAHAGPAFGAAVPLDSIARARLSAQDAESLAAIRDGDASAFFEHSRRELDSRRLCGLSPIYLALRLLADAGGESVGYSQRPADADGGSVVSISGVLLYERT